MKIKLFVLFLFLHIICISQEIPEEERLKFVNNFIELVIKHNSDLVIENLDETFIKKQLKKTLKGNKTQILDEWFIGNNENSQEYLSVPFDSIISMEIESIEYQSEFMTNYFFKIKTEKDKLICELILIHKYKHKKWKLGFQGAFG